MSTDINFEPVKSGIFYFISYSHKDSDTVSKYLLPMLKDNLPVRYGKDIKCDTEFERDNSSSIRRCEAVLLFISKNSFEKEETLVSKDLSFAKRYDKPIHVIYIEKIGKNDVPAEYGFLWEESMHIHSISAYKQDIETTISEIYKAIDFVPNITGNEKSEFAALKRSSVDKRYSPLSPTGYKYYLGGQPYSDDPMILVTFVNGLRVKKLKEALRDIFYHWNTDQVFMNNDGSELKAEFMKLIRTACRDSDIDGEKIDEILSDSAGLTPVGNKNSKFFRLFYEVIFKGKDRPKEFYWSNSHSLATLTPVFSDVGDFSDKFSDRSSIGDNVRRIFSDHTKEICNFLEIDDQSKLIDSIMISSVERRGEVIWLDNSGEPPVNLGTVSNFIKSMKTFDDPKSMKNMVNFLRRFSFVQLSNGSDLYTLKSREEDSRLRVIHDNRIKNESEIGEMLGVGAVSKEDLSNYFTLLTEYIKITRSPTLEIATRFGNISFSTDNFVSDVRQKAKEYCEIVYGEDVSEDLKYYELPKKTCFVKLAQALESLKVLSADKNGDSCDRYIPLLDHGPSMAIEYIKLFENDNPTVIWKNRSVPLAEYISDKISSLSVSALSDFIENTTIVSAYINRDKKLTSNADREFEMLFTEQEQAFNEFEKYIASIVRDESDSEGRVEAEDSDNALSDAPNVISEAPPENDQKQDPSDSDTEAPNESASASTNVNACEDQAEKAPGESSKASETQQVPNENDAPTRRARQPRNKSADTSDAEKRLLELLGTYTNKN